MSKIESGWWDEFFPTFRPVFDIIPARSSNAQARFVIEKLRLKPGHKFLDLACGVGRLSLPLARKSIRVTGVDIMEPYLEELNRKAKRRGLKVKTVHCDMRRIDFREEFDAAGNIWTSFGFFDKESEDLLVLKRMHQALKPGGRCMLNLINRDWILANFQTRSWFPAGDLKIIEDRSFDYENSRSIGVWHFVKDGQEKTYTVDLRVYAYHELVRMFKRAGFVDIEGYAGITENQPTHEDRMLTIVGTKKK